MTKLKHRNKDTKKSESSCDTDDGEDHEVPFELYSFSALALSVETLENFISSAFSDSLGVFRSLE